MRRALARRQTELGTRNQLDLARRRDAGPLRQDPRPRGGGPARAGGAVPAGDPALDPARDLARAPRPARPHPAHRHHHRAAPRRARVRRGADPPGLRATAKPSGAPPRWSARSGTTAARSATSPRQTRRAAGPSIRASASCWRCCRTTSPSPSATRGCTVRSRTPSARWSSSSSPPATASSRWTATITIVGWNPASERIFGLSTSEALGRPRSPSYLPATTGTWRRAPRLSPESPVRVFEVASRRDDDAPP